MSLACRNIKKLIEYRFVCWLNVFSLCYEGDSICNEIALITPPTHGLELYTI